MSQTKLPMSIEALEAIIHEIAQTTANVYFTDHCRERLDQRGVTLIEAIRCLRRGL